MRFCLASLLCALILLLGADISAAEHNHLQGDGEYIFLETDNVPQAISLDPSGNTRLVRYRKEVWLLRVNELQEEERIFLGKVDLRNPEAAEVIVLDADYDGRPEFLLKFDSSNPNQFYCLVDENGEPLGEALFNDPYMEFANPTFQASTHTLTAWDRSGGLATYIIYKYRSGQYLLTEETEIMYEASRLILERRTQYLGNGKTRENVRAYGDMDNKPVRLSVAAKVRLFAQPEDEEPSRHTLSAGQSIIVTDAAVGPNGHRLKVQQPNSGVSGWVPEEAFLILLTEDSFLAAAPGSSEPAPGNLSGPYIPADTEVALLGVRQAQDGQVWCKVYYLEGDVTGWIKKSETTAVELPESQS